MTVHRQASAQELTEIVRGAGPATSSGVPDHNVVSTGLRALGVRRAPNADDNHTAPRARARPASQPKVNAGPSVIPAPG